MNKSENGKVVNLHEEDMLMEKLTDPETIYQLTRLLDRVEQVNLLFDFLETFLARGPSMADSVNSLIVEMRENIDDLGYIHKINEMTESLKSVQHFIDSEPFKQLQKTMLNTETLELVQKVSESALQAHRDAQEQEMKRIGLFGLVRELGNPDIQPAIQFLLKFSKHLSKESEDA